MARAVGGIDLVNNSAIAVLEGGEPTIILNAEGGCTTPLRRGLQVWRGLVGDRWLSAAVRRHQRRPHHLLGQRHGY